MQKRLLALALFSALCGVMSAQTSGEITGEVKDQSGAVAAGAAITVTNSATNVSRSTVTNSAGVYSFPNLVPGTYQVKVVVAGFDTIVKNGIELQVQATVRADFDLKVGQSTQTVEVSGMAAMLTTESATVGTVIEEKRITDLPLNGRNFFSLVPTSRTASRPRRKPPDARVVRAPRSPCRWPGRAPHGAITHSTASPIRT
jgi:hypothetical protein